MGVADVTSKVLLCFAPFRIALQRNLFQERFAETLGRDIRDGMGQLKIPCAAPSRVSAQEYIIDKTRTEDTSRMPFAVPHRSLSVVRRSHRDSPETERTHKKKSSKKIIKISMKFVRAEPSNFRRFDCHNRTSIQRQENAKVRATNLCTSGF